jgi:hypothetical protein
MDGIVVYLPAVVAVGWIAMGLHYCITGREMTLTFRVVVWRHRERLTGRAVTFMGTSTALLGVLVLIFIAVNLLFFDTNTTATVLTERDTGEPANLTGLRIWFGTLCFGLPYLFATMGIAVLLNRTQYQKAKPKR